MTTISLKYTLRDLPSSQHRAGLAGLVEILKWREKLSGKKGIAKIVKVERAGAEFEFDEAGIANVFDIIYAAAEIEREVANPYKDKQGEIKPPLRTEEREVVSKTGKTSTKTYYFYPEVVPHGAFLLHRDPSRSDSNGLWIKLWRDFTWSIMRGVPATRRPYNDRAQKRATSDAAKSWKSLSAKGKPKSVELPSTVFIGVQSKTAESIPFRDQPDHFFLLHFWSFVAQINVPQVPDPKNSGRRTMVGYAVVVPDICDLELFCDEFDESLNRRSPEKAGYRPKEALVDIPEEAAFKQMLSLQKQLSKRVNRDLSDLVIGFDVFHLEKDGNNVRVRSVSRLKPDSAVLLQYQGLSDYWNPRFRTLRLQSLVSHRDPWHGFDRLCSTTSIADTFDEWTFRHDASVVFRRVKGSLMSDDKNNPRPAEDQLEELVYDIAKQYVNRKAGMKSGLTWKSSEKSEYNNAVEKTARSAFLAVRSRNNEDFIEYFTGTLCSVPQFLPKERFERLSKALLEDSRHVRTLTMMALSAAAYVSKPKTDKEK